MARTKPDGAPEQGRSVALGGGLTVPYPEPSSPEASAIGRGNRRTGTKPELALRSELHRRGLRFRKDHPVRTSGRVVRPDIVFTRARVAVFVDGCFWHGCPEHRTIPRRNQDYWIPKLQRNIDRDAATADALRAEGWLPVRIWEHEGVVAAADRVERMVAEARLRSWPTNPADHRPPTTR